MKTVKVRRGLHNHVGSDRRLVVGQVPPCFMVPRPKGTALELGVTNQQLVAIDWFTGGFCVDSLHREQAQGLMYSQATVRGKFSRAVLVAKWCHALT